MIFTLPIRLDFLIDLETREGVSHLNHTMPLVGPGSRSCSTDSILRSLIATTGPENPDNSNQVDVDEYLLFDHDMDDVNKRHDDE